MVQKGLIENNLPPVTERTKHKFGQYFTPKIVAEFMVSLAQINSNSKVLEPSCGEGVFLEVLQEKGVRHLDAYEIDTELGRQFDFIKYESFVTAKCSTSYDLIIGNPPYIRWKNLEDSLKDELASHPLWTKYFNSLCDYLYIFILKSIELLNENGQLIFICPEYWMNTTHSISLRNYMVENGYFECIYHFNETPIFNNATVSVVVFKYIKSQRKPSKIEVVKYYKNKALTPEILEQIQNKNTTHQDIKRFVAPQFEKDKRWLLSDINEIKKIERFEKSCSTQVQIEHNLFDQKVTSSYPTIGDICDIGNGMVSGLDKAFQLNVEVLNEKEETNTIQVIKAKNLTPYLYKDITKYIFVNHITEESEFRTDYPAFYNRLIEYKVRLDKRYQYNRQINYWEWVFLRNYNLFNSDCPRIFVPCKERISNKNHFRFAYVPAGIFPTQDVTAIFPKAAVKESIYYILAFLNNHRVFDWLRHKGIVKGNIVEFSEKPISSIPFRKIDWTNKKEVDLHQEISTYTKQYLESQERANLSKVEDLIDTLLSEQ